MIRSMQKELTVRQARPEDLEGIIDLFLTSLGTEGGVPTIRFWKWKHVNNPFGESPVLLALDDEEIVGLRAFMRWQWQYKGKTYPAFRAVDTATHPDYRGRGIFKKLTTQLVDKIIKDEPHSFIFNTPNDMSRPGYLKMGWEILGKPELRIMAIPPLPGRRNIIEPSDEVIERVISKHTFDKNYVHTNYSPEYVTWRYREVPDLPYYLCHMQDDNGEVIVAFEIRQKKWKECRICDVFFYGSSAKKLFKKALYAIASTYKPAFFGFINTTEIRSLISFPLIPVDAKKYAPQITIRQTGDEKIFKDIRRRERWNPTIGAVSLF